MCIRDSGGTFRARRLVGLKRHCMGTDAGQGGDQPRTCRTQEGLSAGQRQTAAGRCPSVMREEARPPRPPEKVSRHLKVQSTRLARHAACDRLHETRSRRRALPCDTRIRCELFGIGSRQPSGRTTNGGETWPTTGPVSRRRDRSQRCGSSTAPPEGIYPEPPVWRRICCTITTNNCGR